MPLSLRHVLVISMSLFLLTLPSFLRAEDEDNPRAARELRILAARMEAKSVDEAKLAGELRAFRRKFPGTPQSVQAAVFLSRIVSPLDKLDPKKIKELEKFDWQPKNLVAILGEHRGRHGASVSDVAFSPNGKWIASGGGRWVRTWDKETMRLISRVGHSSGSASVIFSNDSKRLASGGSGYIYVWDVLPNGSLKRYGLARVGSARVSCVSFSPDGKLVAGSCSDNSTHLFDISGPKPKNVAKIGGHDSSVTQVKFSPNGKMLVTGSSDNTVKLWKLAGNIPEAVGKLEAHSSSISTLAFSPSSGLLISGDAKGIGCIWKMPSGNRARPIATFDLKSRINDVTFSPSGKYFATASSDGIIRFWPMSTRPVPRSQLKSKIPNPTSLDYSPDTKLLVVGGNDWTVRTYSLTARGFPERFEPWSHLSQIYSMDYAPDGEKLATVSYDRILRVWDLTREEPRTEHYLKGHGSPIYRVAYSPDGKMIATGGSGRTIRQWNSESGLPLRTINAKIGSLTLLTYTPDSAFLLAGYKRQFSLFDRLQGKHLRLCEADSTGFNCISLSPNGKYVMTGSGHYLLEKGKVVKKDGVAQYVDCKLRLWDLDKGELIEESEAHKFPISRAIYLPGTSKAITADWGDKPKQWLSTKEKLKELDKPELLTGVNGGWRYSPDGTKLMVMHGGPSTLYIFDVPSKKLLHKHIFQESISSFDFSNDSRHVGVGLGTGVIYILRLADQPKKVSAVATP